jgi:hypothetical protein
MRYTKLNEAMRDEVLGRLLPEQKEQRGDPSCSFNVYR